MEVRCKVGYPLVLALVFFGSFWLFNSLDLNLFSLPQLNSSFNATKWNSSSSALNGKMRAILDANRTVYNLTSFNVTEPPWLRSDNGGVKENVTELTGLRSDNGGVKENVTELTGLRLDNHNSSVKEDQKVRRRVISKIELELRQARAAIKDADRFRNVTFHNTVYVLRGGIYRNAWTFQQSYAEMEKRFKMFVYPEGEPPLVHGGPCKSIYSIEGRFIHELEIGNPFLTSNPKEAHVYFLPFSVTRMVGYIYKRDSHDMTPLRRFASDYIHVVANKYPFWNRSLGADHFMLSCHDWGPYASMANSYLYYNSIRVLCNANTSEGFNPAKDVSLPEVNLETGLMTGLLGGQSALRRTLLAFFAGRNHGPVRPLLYEHWKDKDDDIQVYEYLPMGMSYYDMLRKSRYCLCPSGYEVASPRIVEAIYSECVPVILSDHYALPFSDVLNWNAFSVQVPLSEIPNLKTILQSISVKKYVQMQRRVKQLQKHFTINQPPKPFDLFHMIIHSIWLRRLNVQIVQ